MILVTLLRFCSAFLIFMIAYEDDIKLSENSLYDIFSLIFSFLQYNICGIICMITVHRTEKATSELFNISIASTYKLSSLVGSSGSLSNDLLKTSSILK